MKHVYTSSYRTGNVTVCFLGSEADSDENYDGDSDADKSLVFSGDEDDLPSDSELKNQLGKIYLYAYFSCHALYKSA
jgi:hypothetical protein